MLETADDRVRGKRNGKDYIFRPGKRRDCRNGGAFRANLQQKIRMLQGKFRPVREETREAFEGRKIGVKTDAQIERMLLKDIFDFRKDILRVYENDDVS